MFDLNTVFDIIEKHIEVAKKQFRIILTVNVKNDLIVARNPFVNANMQYISIIGYNSRIEMVVVMTDKTVKSIYSNSKPSNSWLKQEVVNYLRQQEISWDYLVELVER